MLFEKVRERLDTWSRSCCRSIPAIMGSPWGTTLRDRLLLSWATFGHGILLQQQRKNSPVFFKRNKNSRPYPPEAVTPGSILWKSKWNGCTVHRSKWETAKGEGTPHHQSNWNSHGREESQVLHFSAAISHISNFRVSSSWNLFNWLWLMRLPKTWAGKVS